MAKDTTPSPIRYYIRWDQKQYEDASIEDRQKIMRRAIRFYSILKRSCCPSSDKSVKEMTHREKRVQEWKMWKYVKHITKSKSWSEYERHMRQLVAIVGEEYLIVDWSN